MEANSSYVTLPRRQLGIQVKLVPSLALAPPSHDSGEDHFLKVVDGLAANENNGQLQGELAHTTKIWWADTRNETRGIARKGYQTLPFVLAEAKEIVVVTRHTSKTAFEEGNVEERGCTQRHGEVTHTLTRQGGLP
jgi:hypothetical protein